mmetsp:Transcript_27462/g.59678  ORF Transcript_27462/g.59678 Transcript_27462/m.59678 type:complete len:260 (-) Transcript_27462:268-1047(-)
MLPPTPSGPSKSGSLSSSRRLLLSSKIFGQLLSFLKGRIPASSGLNTSVLSAFKKSLVSSKTAGRTAVFACICESFSCAKSRGLLLLLLPMVASVVFDVVAAVAAEVAVMGSDCPLPLVLFAWRGAKRSCRADCSSFDPDFRFATKPEAFASARAARAASFSALEELAATGRQQSSSHRPPKAPRQKEGGRAKVWRSRGIDGINGINGISGISSSASSAMANLLLGEALVAAASWPACVESGAGRGAPSFGLEPPGWMH